jgi:gamma-glutamyl-gamma-aminobutyrate hydrolase PuuD
VASSASEPPAGAAGGRRPLIGLTTYRERAATGVWDTEFALLHSVYVDAVARAGGVPVLLPPQEHGADEAVERLDGLVLSGGSDVDPERYQQQPGRHTTVVRPWRDDWELRLLDRALAADLPVLGVCRGAQLLNVALGGTLDQHLPDTVGHQRHCPGPGVFGQTVVTLRPGSVLAGVLGPAVTVPCYHHQAIDKLAAELEVAARSADGTVEAVELPGRRFALGVQWHPEQDGDDLRLFAALVAAAAARTPGAAPPAVPTPGAATPGAATPESRTSEQNQGASRVGL